MYMAYGALHFLTPHPPARRWYRTGDAALYQGISPKTLTLTVDRRAFAQRG
jgi:hypothetical protein